MKMRQVFANLMLELGCEDKKLVVLVGDISHGILQPFAKQCQGRYFNVGICEPTIVSMAAGISKVGLYPVVHTIAPFIVERSFEQIKLDFSYQNLGGNLVVVGSAFDYAALGCSHHCYDDFALLKPLPETQIFYPSSPVEFQELFKANYTSGKINYFRLPEEQHSQVFSKAQIETGKAIKVCDGHAATIVVTGPHLDIAIHAAETIRGGADVLYYPCVKPFDCEAVQASARKTKSVLVIEEHSRYGGLGDEVLRSCIDLGIRYDTIAIEDRWTREYGTYRGHCERLGFTAENLKNRLDRLIH